MWGNNALKEYYINVYGTLWPLIQVIERNAAAVYLSLDISHASRTRVALTRGTIIVLS